MNVSNVDRVLDRRYNRSEADSSPTFFRLFWREHTSLTRIRLPVPRLQVEQRVDLA